MPDGAVFTGRRRASRRATAPGRVVLCAAAILGATGPALGQDLLPFGNHFLAGQLLEPAANFSVVEGKVKFSKGLALINKGGYASRGTVVNGAAFGNRIRVSLADTVDVDEKTLKPAIDPFAPLGARRALNLEAEIVRDREFNLVVAGSVLDSRRDITRKDAPWETVGEKTNTAAGGGFRLGLWQDRLRWSSELGWSRSEAWDILAGAPAGRSRAVRRKRAAAQRHRIDAAFGNSDRFLLKGHGAYKYVPAGYAAGKGDAKADRETLGFGVKARFGPVGLKAARGENHNNLDRIDNALTIRDRKHSASVSLDTTAFQAGKSIPDKVSLSLAHRRVRGLPGDSTGIFADADVPDKVTGTVGLSLGWIRGAHAFKLKFAAGFLDNRQSGQESADEERRSVVLGHAFKAAGWTASFNLSATETVNRTRGARWLARSFAPAAELRLAEPGWPTVAGKFTLKHNRKHLLDAADSDIATTWKLGGALDFGKFLPDRADDQYLLLTLEARGNGPNATDTAGAREVDYVIGVSANIRF